LDGILKIFSLLYTYKLNVLLVIIIFFFYIERKHRQLWLLAFCGRVTVVEKHVYIRQRFVTKNLKAWVVSGYPSQN